MTNINFLSAVTAHRAFAEAHQDSKLLDTGLIERHRSELLAEPAQASDAVLAIATLSERLRMDREAAQQATRSPDPHAPWNARHGWRLNEDNHHRFVFLDAGRRLEIVAHYRPEGYLLELPGGRLLVSGTSGSDGRMSVDLAGQRESANVARLGNTLTVFAQGASHRLEFEVAAAVEEEDPSARLVSPLPGSVIQVLVAQGDTVAKGQALMIIEAMKMEHTVSAPGPGKVSQIYFSAGEQVAEGAKLLEFEAIAGETT